MTAVQSQIPQQPPDAPVFLDVDRLLHASVPKPRTGWFGYALASLLVVVLMSALVVVKSGAPREQVQVMSAVAVLGIVLTLVGMFMAVVRRHRAEHAMVQAAGELVQLRRWPQAAIVLEQILSRPSTSHPLRSQSLVYLSSVLARYHRFDDAISVQDHLLDHELIDANTAFGLRVGRAMAMLREDHLFDADRAMSELRRLEGTQESAGLALVEICRDVKTGHPDEAIEIFQARLPTLRDQLGHRVADAYALVSRAFDLRSRHAESRDAWEKATLLAPATELVRRYPEVKPVAEKYAPSLAPADALG